MRASIFCRITVSDGDVIRDGKKWLTSPMDVAREISQGRAGDALIAEYGW